MNQRTLIIDGTFFLYRNFHSQNAWDLKVGDIKTGGCFVFLRSVHQALERVSNINRVIVAWDGGRSARRMELLPEYKGNRDQRKPILVEGQEIDIHAEFRQQKEMLEEVFTHLGIRSITLGNREGDDVIWVATRLVGRAVVVSDDKDMLTMLQPTIDVYRPSNDEYYTWKSFAEEHGYDPDIFAAYKAIVGDKSDNIEGVVGAGPKTAEKFCLQLQALGKDYDAALNWCSAQSDKKLVKISEQRERLARNLKLMDCSNEPFSPEEIQFIQRRALGPRVPVDHDAFIRFCDRFKFATLTGDAWFIPFAKLI